MEVTIRFAILNEERYKVNCLFELIKNCYNQKAVLTINDTDNIDVQLPDAEQFLSFGAVRNCLIIDRNHKNVLLSARGCIEYCKAILKQMPGLDDCTNQYKILRKCGIPQQTFKLMMEINDSELSSIASGSPYPYVVTEWMTTFKSYQAAWEEEKRQKQEEERQKQLIEEAKAAFDAKDKIEDRKEIKADPKPKAEIKKIDNSCLCGVKFDEAKNFQQISQIIQENNLDRREIAKFCGIAPRSFRYLMDNPNYPRANEFVNVVNQHLGSHVELAVLENGQKAEPEWAKITTFGQLKDITRKYSLGGRELAKRCGINYPTLVYILRYSENPTYVMKYADKINKNLGCNISSEKTQIDWTTVTTIEQFIKIVQQHKLNIYQIATDCKVSAPTIHNILKTGKSSERTIRLLNERFGCNIIFNDKAKRIQTAVNWASITTVEQFVLAIERHKIDQTYLAEKCGIPISVFCSIATRNTASAETLRLINKFLGCNIEIPPKKPAESLSTDESKEEIIKKLKQQNPSGWQVIIDILKELNISQRSFVEISGIKNLPHKLNLADVAQLNKLFGWNLGHKDTYSYRFCSVRHK